MHQLALPLLIGLIVVALAFDFLNDPLEEIYSDSDGEAV